MTDEDDGFYAQHDRDTLVQFTVFEHPDDFPEDYVVRRVEVRRGGKLIVTPYYRVARTLEEARARLPAGLFPLARDPSDHPSVLETWI